MYETYNELTPSTIHNSMTPSFQLVHTHHTASAFSDMWEEGVSGCGNKLLKIHATRVKTGVPNLTPVKSQGRSHFRLSLPLFLCGETLKVFPNVPYGRDWTLWFSFLKCKMRIILPPRVLWRYNYMVNVPGLKKKRKEKQIILIVIAILCKCFCVPDNVASIISFRYYLPPFIEKAG